MPTNTKSTLTETIILSAALARRDRHVLPLPDGADATSPIVAGLLKRMLAAGLLEERRTTSAKRAWRAGPDDQQYLLRVTELGRTAGEASLAVEAMPDVADADLAVPTSESGRPSAPSGKLGKVLSAVQSGDGASIDDLVDLTGWQPHTVRASLTRLRQTGVPIRLTGQNGQRRYTAAQTTETFGR